MTSTHAESVISPRPRAPEPKHEHVTLLLPSGWDGNKFHIYLGVVSPESPAADQNLLSRPDMLNFARAVAQYHGMAQPLLSENGPEIFPAKTDLATLTFTDMRRPPTGEPIDGAFTYVRQITFRA